MTNMDLLKSLTMKIIELHNTPKYLFWKKRRLEREISEIQDKIRNQDIFNISGAALSYLISSINDFKELELNEFAIEWNISNMQITITDDASIIYYPRLNRFNVCDVDKSYTIYRNTSVPKILQDDWNTISTKLKEIYIVTVSNITELKFIA